MFAPESVELLQKSGIDFERHEEIGILPNDFAELVITSGLVLTDETRWISFHRFVITCCPLPPSLRELSPGAAVATTLATSSSSSPRCPSPQQRRPSSTSCTNGSPSATT